MNGIQTLILLETWDCWKCVIEKDVALIKIRRITLQTHKPRFEKSNRNKIEKGNLKQNEKETSFAIKKSTQE